MKKPNLIRRHVEMVLVAVLFLTFLALGGCSTTCEKEPIPVAEQTRFQFVCDDGTSVFGSQVDRRGHSFTVHTRSKWSGYFYYRVLPGRSCKVIDLAQQPENQQ